MNSELPPRLADTARCGVPRIALLELEGLPTSSSATKRPQLARLRDMLEPEQPSPDALLAARALAAVRAAREQVRIELARFAVARPAMQPKTETQSHPTDKMIERLRSHGVFEPLYYAEVSGLKKTDDLWGHYLAEGRRKGLDVHPLLDTAAAHAAGGPAHLSASEWYAMSPRAADGSTHPLFNRAYYIKANNVILKRGETALQNFLNAPRRTGRLTHPAFDTAFYGQIYSDVVGMGLDPVWHFAAFGAREGRAPSAEALQLMDEFGGLISRPGLSRVLIENAPVYEALDEAGLAKVLDGEKRRRAEARRAAFRRPIRILRKRLRAWGLLRKPVQKPLGLAALKQHVPSLAPFLSPMEPYDAWVEANAVTTASTVDLNERLAERSGRLPAISIVTPIYNTPANDLREMVASVHAQIYRNWELCLVDDASTASHVWPLLQALAAEDPRIRVRRSEVNGGISVASNAAADLATGDIIALLDHDDVLTPDALAEIAIYYAEHPKADLVYSDDDKIDADGRRYAPQFKPDWSPTLLLSYMYLGHLLTLRRSLFEDIGGFRPAFDGSQDHDLALRATEKAREVGHVAKVLYHWRAAEGSTATSGAAKPYSFAAGAKAVQDALDRRAIAAVASHPYWALRASVGMYEIAFPDAGSEVTIVIPSYNQAPLLRDCVESLAATTYENFTVLVIDNGSDDSEALAYLDDLRRRPNHAVRVIPQRADGFSFAALMNAAIAEVATKFVLLLNNDTRVIEPRWLSQMMGLAGMDGVGSVGARLYFGDDTVQHAGVVQGFHEGLVGHAFRNAPRHDWGYMGLIRSAREVSAVTAACMVTPVDLFRSLGGFDEDQFAVAYNDADYGFRLLEAGYRNVYCGDAVLYHFEGKTRPKRDNPAEVAALRRKYGTATDPWHNVNLTLEREDFSLSTRRSSQARGRVRVAVVSHNLNREGAPTVLLDQILGLKSQGVIDPVVLSYTDGPLRTVYEDAGIVVELLPPRDHAADRVAYEARIQGLARRFTALDAQVVLTNTLTTFEAVNAANIAGVKAIWCQHESEPWQTYFDHVSPGQQAYAYAAFGQAYRVTYVADATRRAWAGVQTRGNAELIRHATPPERLKTELERWTRSHARERLQVFEDDFVILIAGTICQRKGQMDVVRMIGAVSADVADRCRVFLTGAFAEPAYMAEIKAAIADLPPSRAERLIFVGLTEDMPLYYSAADLIVCTSRIESAPRVIVEAMSFGLPVVTTPVFGIPELVDEGVNALFYPPGDFMVLAGRVSQLLLDPELRASLGRAGPSGLASRPSYEDMISSYATLIREAALMCESAAGCEGTLSAAAARG